MGHRVLAARSQKHVTFLNKPQIRGTLVYRALVRGREPETPRMVYRFVNRKADGLGEPIPAGKVILYQGSPWDRQLVGQATLADKTTDEEVELEFGEASGVTVESRETALRTGARYTLTLRDANPFPVHFELEFRSQPDARVTSLPGRVVRKPGKMVWQVMLAPNSESSAIYSQNDVD